MLQEESVLQVKRGPPAFDINTRVTFGCLHAGIGRELSKWIKQ